jgi:hypothetical protein
MCEGVKLMFTWYGSNDLHFGPEKTYERSAHASAPASPPAREVEL